MRSLYILIVLIVMSFQLSFGQSNYCDYPQLFEEPIASLNGTPTFEPAFFVYQQGCRNIDPNNNDCNVYINMPNDSLKEEVPLRPTIVGVHGYCYYGLISEILPLCDESSAFLMSLQLLDIFAQYGFVTASVQYQQWIDDFALCDTPQENIAATHYRAIIQVRKALNYLYDNAESFGVDKDQIYLYGNSQGGLACTHAVFLEDENEFFTVFPEYAYLVNTYGPLPPRVPIKGIVNLSGVMYDLSFIDANENSALLLGHGTCDTGAPYGSAKALGCENFPVVHGSLSIAQRAGEMGIQNTLYSIQNMGHGWPDNMVEGIGPIVRPWIKRQICGTPPLCEQFFIDADSEESCAVDTTSTTGACAVMSSIGHVTASEHLVQMKPNPFRETLTIDHSTCTDCEGQLVIHGIDGKECINRSFRFNQSISTQSLKPGIYIASVYDKDRSLLQKKKLIKVD